MRKRIGHQMTAAANYVTDNPGCTKMAVAAAVGPNGSLRFGYEVVDRAIHAGLIQAHQTPRGAYQLFPADWDVSEIIR